MASKLLIIALALAVLTTAIVAANQDVETMLQDLLPMAKRGKGRRRNKGRGGAYLAENLFCKYPLVLCTCVHCLVCIFLNTQLLMFKNALPTDLQACPAYLLQHFILHTALLHDS